MKAYFSHDEGARNDPKLVEVLMALGHEGKSVYWDLVEMLYEQGGHLMLSQCKGYAFALRTNCDLILRLVNDFGLFVNDGTKFWSETALRRLEQRNAKSAKAKESASKRWAASERNANALQTQSEGNAIKEKEIKGNTTDVVAHEQASASSADHSPLKAEKKPTKSELVALAAAESDVQVFSADDWPGLTNPATFASICRQLALPTNLDQATYRAMIQTKMRGLHMKAPASTMASWIASFFVNERRNPKGLLVLVAPTYNETASNAQAGAITGSTIPAMSSMLKPTHNPH